MGTKQIKLLPKGQGCPSCGHRGVIMSSAFDGRPSYTCDNCGNHWTDGRKPNQGYQWKKDSMRAE